MVQCDGYRARFSWNSGPHAADAHTRKPPRAPRAITAHTPSSGLPTFQNAIGRPEAPPPVGYAELVGEGLEMERDPSCGMRARAAISSTARREDREPGCGDKTRGRR